MSTPPKPLTPPLGPVTNSGLFRLQTEIVELRESIKQLTVLNDIAQALSGANDSNAVLDVLVSKTLQYMGAEQGVIWLFTEDENNPLKTQIRRSEGAVSGPMRLRPSLAGWVSKHQQTLVVDDLGTDPRFPGISTDTSGVRSVLAAPLRSQDKLIGVLALFNKKEGRFTRSDEQLATILGAQSAQTILNAQLTDQQRLQEALERDMKLASTVQQQLLPRKRPTWVGFEVAGKNIPARDVGGDSFEFLELGEGRVALSIADVSGKGVPAALLMASLHATLLCLSQTRDPVSECVSRVNRMVCEATTPGRFATMWYGTIDLATRRITYCNAGHNPPLLLRANGTVEHLEAGGVPVGFMPEWKYEQAEAELRSGDILLLYSDGLSEAENPRGTQFSDEGVEVLLKSLAHLPPEQIVEQMLLMVKRFAQGAPQTDDQTLVVLKTL